jgi:hypothetical protein
MIAAIKLLTISRPQLIVAMVSLLNCVGGTANYTKSATDYH